MFTKRRIVIHSVAAVALNVKVSKVVLDHDDLLTHQRYVYSRVPNKRTGRLLENEKKSHLYTLIWDYSFIDLEQKVPPICLFRPMLLYILELSHLFFIV